MINDGLYSSKKNDWRTPKKLWEKLNKKYNFNVDLCASKDNHLCKEYYSLENSALNVNLKGKRIFCNPPYGREIGKFIRKCYELSKNNLVVMLLPSRTDTRWFHNYIWQKGNKILFFKGRLKFNDQKNSAPFPSLLVEFKKL